MQMNGAVVEHAGLWLENALQSNVGDVLLTSPYLSFTECARVERAAQEQLCDPLLADQPGVQVAARAAGCDPALSRSKFFGDLEATLPGWLS